MSAGDMSTPTVSVCMITYNHEASIAQAIEGVLMQETNFQVELVISEDCSTDGTRAVVIDYAQRYPERIRPLLPERNLGMMPNFIATLEACGGKYVALCEGDDHWTDPHKLQKQVEFLDAHPECSISCHSVSAFSKDNSHAPRQLPASSQKPISGLKDLLRNNFIPTCSVVFRRGSVPKLPKWYFELPMGDWPLWILIAQHGQIGYLDEVMANYRIHSGGVWSSTSVAHRLQAEVRLLEHLKRYLGPDCTRIIRTNLSDRYLVLAARSIEDADMPRAKAFLNKSIFENPPDLLLRFGDVVVMAGRLYVPPVYHALKYVSRRVDPLRRP